MANTFYIDNFYTVDQINVDVSPDALTLSLTLKSRTFRSDVNWTASDILLSTSLKSVLYRASYTIGAEEVLALTIHAPNIILSPNISPDQIDLTLDDKTPTYRSDMDDFTTTVLPLTLTQFDPTYRSDMDAYTADALELLATLKDPSITLSPNVSVTAIALTLVQESSTVVVLVSSRILRKGYTFGATEQLTNSKLHTLIESAKWIISNATTGDMVYYKGDAVIDAWYRVPIGTTGQVLTVGAGGVPEWTTLP
jgi:hypothetical protein